MKRIFLILFCPLLVIATILILGYNINKISSNTEANSQTPTFSSKIVKKQDLPEQNLSEEVKSTNDTEQQQINLSEENQNSQNKQMRPSSNKNNMNEYYYKRYWEIEAKVESMYNDLYITADLVTASGNELYEWDTLLNEVYNYIKGTISSAEFEKLRQSELNWIKERDKNAENAADFDGSMATLEYNGSLISQTKERILWLIDNYITKEPIIEAEILYTYTREEINAMLIIDDGKNGGSLLLESDFPVEAEIDKYGMPDKIINGETCYIGVATWNTYSEYKVDFYIGNQSLKVYDSNERYIGMATENFMPALE